MRYFWPTPKDPMRFFLLLLISLPCFAQHSDQPIKESSTDLRTQNSLFSIEVVDDKKTIFLIRTAGLDYSLRQKIKNEEKMIKISSKEGTRLDRMFASHFIKTQYEIASAEGKCDVALRLNMKGEEQEVCEKDEKKTQEFAPFIDELSKRF